MCMVYAYQKWKNNINKGHRPFNQKVEKFLLLCQPTNRNCAKFVDFHMNHLESHNITSNYLRE